MVLHASDLPPGFLIIRSLSGPSTNSDVIRMEGRAIAPKLKRWGRISGYRAFYRQQRDPVNGRLPGVLAFGAGVSLFRTARGAHAALAEPGYACRDKAFTIIGLGGNRPVGSDTLVCTSPEKIPSVRRRVFLVQWRNGRATGAVNVLTVEGAVTPLAELTGARKQNRRMTAELRRG
jgi:hypothetical protein